MAREVDVGHPPRAEAASDAVARRDRSPEERVGRLRERSSVDRTEDRLVGLELGAARADLHEAKTERKSNEPADRGAQNWAPVRCSPKSVEPRPEDRGRWALAIGASAVFFVLYFRRLCPTLSLTGDSAELVAAGAVWGVPHAPGYPLFTALAHAFEEMQSGVRSKGPIPRHLIWNYTGPPPRRVPGKK